LLVSPSLKDAIFGVRHKNSSDMVEGAEIAEEAEAEDAEAESEEQKMDMEQTTEAAEASWEKVELNIRKHVEFTSTKDPVS
jgi:hypothetical protein